MLRMDCETRLWTTGNIHQRAVESLDPRHIRLMNANIRTGIRHIQGIKLTL